MPPVVSEQVVLTSERHDAWIVVVARQAGQAVAVEAAADQDQVVGLGVISGGPDDDLGAQLVQVRDRRARPDVGSTRRGVCSQGRGDRAVVDDGRMRRMQRREAVCVRLDVFQLLTVHEPDAGNTVGDRTLVDVVQASPFSLVERHDDLAELVVDQVVVGTELLQQPDAAPAELRLQGARRVVQPGVDDPAVAAGLVSREPCFLFQERDPGRGPHLEEAAGDGSADDAAADDSDAAGGHDRARGDVERPQGGRAEAPRDECTAGHPSRGIRRMRPGRRSGPGEGARLPHGGVEDAAVDRTEPGLSGGA